MTAFASAFAVSVRGLVTSMSGVIDTVEMPGPNRANGAKPATSEVPGRTWKKSLSTPMSAAMRACVYRTPLAGPVDPEVKRMAASASGSGSGTRSGETTVPDADAGVPLATSSSMLVSTARSRRWALPSASTLMRRPGQPATRERVRPGTAPMIHCGSAAFTARVIPFGPSPASATTATPPARRTA